MDDPLQPSTMKTLLIVFHSMTGGTRQMVKAAIRGAAMELAVRVHLLSAPVAQAADLLEADGYLFGTPENLAAIVGLMRDFFDRTYYLALDRISGRPYATLICAGSDGYNAARQVERIATGWRLKAMADPLIVCTHAQTPEAILAPLAAHRSDPVSTRLAGIPDASLFQGSREFAGYNGLVPRQHSTGAKARLGSISKLGNRHLRKLLVVGAHAALANKMAWIAWAVMARSTAYEPGSTGVAASAA